MAISDSSKRKSVSIKSKLLFSFLIVIFVLVLLIGTIVFMHFRIVREYETLIDNLILENKITKVTLEFIDSYYSLVLVNAKSNERLQEYNLKKEEIYSTFLKLDKAIINEESKISYRGLKNIVYSIIQNSDKGVEEISRGNLTSAIAYYDDSLHKNFYVVENTAKLTLIELEFAEQLQENINRTRILSLILGSVLLFIVTLGCVIYSIVYSNKLIAPLVELSRLAEKISGGDFKIKLEEGLIKSNDEIGILSDSFNKMIAQLQQKIAQLNQSNMDISKAKEELQNTNDDLEKFNRLAVGRELAMIELKKKIKELENKVPKNEN